jgi:phosphoglucomutase
MVKHDGDYVLLSGNEIGALLMEYLCQCYKEYGALDGRFVCTSMVSTLLADAIGAYYNLEVKRTHVGFKYIGEQMELHPDAFLFGFEESNGYLVGDYARDKDGVVAAKLLCQMAADYKACGKTLIDGLETLYARHGYVLDKTTTISVKNQRESQEMMKCLRDFEAVAGAFDGLTGAVDYADEATETGLPKADVLKFQFEDGARLIVRPSGTEPKVKFYVSACAGSKTACQERMQEMMETLNELIGVK